MLATASPSLANDDDSTKIEKAISEVRASTRASMSMTNSRDVFDVCGDPPLPPSDRIDQRYRFHAIKNIFPHDKCIEVMAKRLEELRAEEAAAEAERRRQQAPNAAAVRALAEAAKAIMLPPERVHALTRETFGAYQRGRHAGILALEASCWKRLTRKAAPAQAVICGTYAFVGVLMDSALSRNEMRGSMPQFSLDEMLTRFEREAKRLSMSEEQTTSAEMAVVAAEAEVYAGLMLAGMR